MTPRQLSHTILSVRRSMIAVVPGDSFHGPDHVRFCYAVDDDRIEEGLRRLGALLGR